MYNLFYYKVVFTGIKNIWQQGPKYLPIMTKVKLPYFDASHVRIGSQVGQSCKKKGFGKKVQRWSISWKI